MPVHHDVVVLETQGNNHVIDVTQVVRDHVTTSLAGVASDGTVTVFSPHTTTGVTALEFETGANRDLGDVLERLIPQTDDYHHNHMDSNGHAHTRAAIVGPSVTIPIVDGTPALGTWQSVAMVDFDDRPRRRTLHLTIVT